MKRRWGRAALVIGAVVVVSVLGAVFRGGSPGASTEATAAKGGVLALVPPAFAQGTVAKSFLETEAGISVYVKLDQKIDLSRARALYKVLEDETDTYLIGSVELVDYGEDWVPHAWVHRDGWVVVYYSKGEPASRLMRWKGYKYGQEGITTTTLYEVLVGLCTKLGGDVSALGATMSYYHWQYPETSRMLVVVDTTNTGSDTFTYTIPAGVAVSEVSASHCGEVGYYNWSNWSHTKINEEVLLNGGEGSYVLVKRVPDKYQIPRSAYTVTIAHRGGWTGVALFFLYR